MTAVIAVAAALTLTGLLGSAEAQDAPRALDRIVVPASVGGVQAEVVALESAVTLRARRDPAALAQAVRRASRALCPEVEDVPGGVRLRCRSGLLTAEVRSAGPAWMVEIEELRGLPWKGRDAPALTAFDPPAVGLGDPCPSSNAAGRAECRLAAGDRSGARKELESVVEGPLRAFADLRLGDLALAADAPETAVARWLRVRGEPWQRLAAARLCELSARCLAKPGWEDAFAHAGLPVELAREMVLRHARALALLGHPAPAAQLLTENDALQPCSGPAGLAFCGRVAALGLRLAEGDREGAFATWLLMPTRNRSVAAYHDELLAAGIAEDLGAPVFGASVLAAGAGRVPPTALPTVLLRTAELYLEGGDRVRAGVVLEFARARLQRRTLAEPRWVAVARALDAPAPARRPDPQPTPADDALLARAQRAVEAARALTAPAALTPAAAEAAPAPATPSPTAQVR